AGRIASLVGQCDPGFHAAGALDTTAAEIGIVNSEGQFCYSPYTQAMVTTVISGGEGGAGYSESWAPRYAELDVEAVGKRAAAKARDSQSPRDLEAGHYEVVLEPAAVGTLVAFLAYMGFGGRALIEGRSCFSGREGERVASEAVTIVDDALTPDTIGLPFDFEGTPKRRGTLIENGQIKHPVKNFRFTQSIIDALVGTSLVGRDTEMVSEFFFSASRVPGLKVDDFHFTGKSDH